jgi:hypothetical protein
MARERRSLRNSGDGSEGRNALTESSQDLGIVRPVNESYDGLD